MFWLLNGPTESLQPAQLAAESHAISKGTHSLIDAYELLFIRGWGPWPLYFLVNFNHLLTSALWARIFQIS